MKSWFPMALLAFAVVQAAPGPVRAADPAPAPAPVAAPASAFSAAQRVEIVQILHDALKADPSILRDAIVALQADNEAQAQAEMQTAIQEHRAELADATGSPIAGNPHGDVTLIEFYDPRCPYCKKMLPTIDAILAKDHGLRVVYKDIPVLGPASVTTVKAILAAENQGGYLKMQAAMMSNPAAPTDDLIQATASKIGLDAAKLKTDMLGGQVGGKIQGNMLLMKSLKVQGTPVFIVGNTVIPGYVGQERLEAAIAEARHKS